MTRIKICGLSRLQDIDAVNQAKPDYIGFVFAKSKRQIDSETAQTLKRALDPDIKAVGVFVNQPLSKIIELAESGIIDVIQLHGDEDESLIPLLKEKTGLPVIRAMRIKTQDDIRKTIADYPLFDTYDPNQYGGSGECFNWDLVDDIKAPFFLAGGLNSQNIEKAILNTHPFCVDISSGVETDGKKDPKKISLIVEKIRRLNNE
jgi:phosphoribosylanthranilate isomerase